MLRSAAGKAMWVGRTTMFVVTIALVVAIVVVGLLAPPAHASISLRACANRPVAYVSRSCQKAVQSLREMSCAKVAHLLARPLSLRFNHKEFCDVLKAHRKIPSFPISLDSSGLLEGRVAFLEKTQLHHLLSAAALNFLRVGE